MDNQPTNNLAPEPNDNKSTQPPQRIRKLPIVIAVVFSVLLLGAGVTLVIASNKSVEIPEPEKPETPEQPTSTEEIKAFRILKEYDYEESLKTIVDQEVVIRNLDELEEFYNAIETYYADTYPEPDSDVVYNEPTKCEDESKCVDGIRPIPNSETSSRLKKPSDLNEDYFKEHDLLVLGYEDPGCGGKISHHIRNVYRDGNIVNIEIGYEENCEFITGMCALSYSIILVEVDKGFSLKSDIIMTEEYQENVEDCLRKIY